MPAKIKRPLTSLKWITTEELAARWGVTPAQISHMLRRGYIPGKKLGDVWIIPADVERPEPPKRGRPRIMTQSEKVLRHLKDYGSITPAEAYKEFGCMRLGARIHDLKRQGYDIGMELETAVNRYGEKTRYARYTLRGGA